VTRLILGPSEVVSTGASNDVNKSQVPACTTREPKRSVTSTKATGNVPLRNSGSPPPKQALTRQEYQNAKKHLKKAVIEYYRCVSFIFAGLREISGSMCIVALCCSASLWQGKIDARFSVLAMRIPRASHLFFFLNVLQMPPEADSFPCPAASRHSIITVYVADPILVISIINTIGIQCKSLS